MMSRSNTTYDMSHSVSGTRTVLTSLNNDLTRGLATIALIAACSVLSLYRLQPPAVDSSSASQNEFSARALAHLEIIAQGPHQIGSAQHSKVRDYITMQLTAGGLTPELQRTTVVVPASGSDFKAASVENIVARLNGTANSKAVLLMAHYDSVPASFGANDNGSGVIALLETQRALSSEPPLKNDVIFLFTDAEEVGSLGAQAFVQEHPWAKDVGLVLNFDARGNGGPSLMFETSDRNSWLINRLCFSIRAIRVDVATEVGPFSDRLDSADLPAKPLRVALLGCGTVGGGVYERLAAFPQVFSVTGVGTRTGGRARALGIPDDLITSNLEDLIEKPCDVVVELIGGTERATALIERSLRLGRSVVTANKAVIAAAGDGLETLAHESGAALRYSAAVGGVLPALETIRRARTVGPLREFSGVLNGTCNFVLDRLATGESMSAAVRKAQEMGYAEARPQMDLNGTDAAQKLILLARAAFGVSLPLGSISRKGIEGLNPQHVSEARKRGQAVRLVARCRRSAQRLEASVEPVALPLDHPLAQVHGVENRLLVEPEVGEGIVVSGKGAGRWPTTEAVMADMFDMKGNSIAG